MDDIDFCRKGYRIALKRFKEAVNSAVYLSCKIGGNPSDHGRQYWASVIFTKMVISGMTLDKVAPKNPSIKSNEIWDVSSVASLSRVIAENYLMLYWLCVQTDEEDLWKFRISVLTIHDNRSRFRMVEEIEGDPEPSSFSQAQSNVQSHLINNRHFLSLDKNKRRSIMKGDKLPFVQDDVISCMGIDRVTFRRIYRYLSSYVHTGTISFFRVEERGGGNGEFNPYDASAIQMSLELAAAAIEGAVFDVKALNV